MSRGKQWSEENKQRLADLVQNARGRRSQEQLSEESSLGLSTIRAIESAQYTRLQTKSLAGIEEVFGWPSGSALRVLTGEPTELEDDTLEQRIAACEKNLTLMNRKLDRVIEALGHLDDGG